MKKVEELADSRHSGWSAAARRADESARPLGGGGRGYADCSWRWVFLLNVLSGERAARPGDSSADHERQPRVACIAGRL